MQHYIARGLSTPCAQVLEGATAVALSCVICYLGSRGAQKLGLPGAVIPVVTGQLGIIMLHVHYLACKVLPHFAVNPHSQIQPAGKLHTQTWTYQYLKCAVN